MCGISGFIKKKDGVFDLSIIEQMNQIIFHRGPDGHGVYYGDNFALGHRRLSIIDTSEGGAQPMYYNEELVIIYNGEIFNYLELREELIGLGYQFKSKSDTEVILIAYKEWKEKCVDKFNGMWAFCIFDKAQNHLFLSRDRFGIKPLYYYEDENSFVFGSEIKQLLLFTNPVANKKVILDYLVLGLEDHLNTTFFNGINKLPCSHNASYSLNNHTFNTSKYYDFIPHKQIIADNEFDLFQEAFFRSIKIRLRSDVKVGTCLSGGLDSSTIAAVASKLYENENPFFAVHAQSEAKSQDESVFANIVSDFCNLDLHIIKPSIEDFKRDVRELVRIQEEPFGGLSVLLQYYVFKKAKEENCIVLLDGQAGDELLLGYERYLMYSLKSLNILQKLKVLYQISQKTKLSFFRSVSYYLYFTIPILRKSLLTKKYSFVKPNYLKEVSFEILTAYNDYKSITELQIKELFEIQLPHLLRYEDKNSMYHSIESRLPFLDFDLVETCLNLSDKMKFNHGWSKYILRMLSEKNLPSQIAWRKDKKGFEAPEKVWLNDKDAMINEIKKSQILSELLTSFSGLKNLDSRVLWRYYNLKMWEEIYNVKL